jgi:hypothetical protein
MVATLEHLGKVARNSTSLRDYFSKLVRALDQWLPQTIDHRSAGPVTAAPTERQPDGAGMVVA